MDADLLGSWSATRWQYGATGHHELLVDVVAGLRGSVTMSLSEGAFVLTWDIPGRGVGSLGGTIELSDGLLTLRQRDGSADALRYRVAAHTLVLNADESRWDFDGSGAVAAGFAAVLVRL